MRFLLASAPHADTFGYSMPPPGLLRLGGWLRRNGIEVLLEDLAYRQASLWSDAGEQLADDAAALLAQKVRDGATCLGFSVMGATLPIGLCIAERMRRAFPTLPILIGGPGTQGVDAALIERFPFVDAVLRGEGEEALTGLLTDAQTSGTLSFRGHAGFTWRDPSGRIVREPDRSPLADLDAVAAPAWDLLPPLADYKALTGAADGLVPVDSGRGCAYDCSFCTIGRYWRRRSRALSPLRLADEIEALQQLPGARQAYLCHDIFGADKQHALAFCNELEHRKDAGRALPFEVRARLDHLDAELIERMAAAGCYRVLVGVESASKRVREAANKDLKGTDTAELERRVLLLAEAGITPILSLILGLPGEEREDLADSLNFLARTTAHATRGGAQVSLHLVNPQPGCGLSEGLADATREVPGIPPDMALGAGLTAPERVLIEAHPDLFSTWHLLTNQVGGAAHLRFLHEIAREVPEVLMRYPRTHLAVMQHTGQGALELFEQRRAQKIIFDTQARLLADERIDALLAWEQSKLRGAARLGPWRQGTLDFEDGGRPIELHHEPLELPADIEPNTPLGPAYFLVGRATPTDFTSAMATRRISADLFHIYQDLGKACRGHAAPPARELLEHLATLEGGALISLPTSPPALRP